MPVTGCVRWKEAVLLSLGFLFGRENRDPCQVRERALRRIHHPLSHWPFSNVNDGLKKKKNVFSLGCVCVRDLGPLG